MSKLFLRNDPYNCLEIELLIKTKYICTSCWTYYFEALKHILDPILKYPI